jgi:hypothetical protein
MQNFSFSLEALAICSPATGCVSDSRQALEWSDNTDTDGWKPDTSFIPKRKFRRLSRLSKMALYAAHHATLESESVHKLGAAIFCSRFGEFKHTESVLDAIHSKDLVSPMDFSYSVHNTAQGLFSILRGDNTPATAIAARHDGLENALLKAYAQLKDGDEAVMIVYHEDTLPEIYDSLLNVKIMPLAFAFVVSKSKEGRPLLTLSFQAEEESISPCYNNDHAVNVAKMLGNGRGDVTLNTNRLQWNWQLK